MNNKDRKELGEIIAIVANSVEDSRSPYEILGQVESKLRRLIES